MPLGRIQDSGFRVLGFNVFKGSLFHKPNILKPKLGFRD